MRRESSSFARLSSAFLDGFRFLPALFMKKVNILIPDPGPLGETFFEASERAIVSAPFVKSPSGGNEETVFTLCDHFFGPLVFFAVLAI
jgi:hypothetical protein